MILIQPALCFRSMRAETKVKIEDTEFKISQFADDTTFLLEGDKQSYEKLFSHLNLLVEHLA